MVHTTITLYHVSIDLSRMHYFDRYLQLKGDLEGDSKSDTFLQLLALTALYVACKIEGSRGCCLEVFVKFSAGKFTCQKVKTMEIELMFTLQWLLNPPLPQDFSKFFTLQLSKSVHCSRFTQIVQEVSNYIIEVVIHIEKFKLENASVLGCASTLISLQGVKSSLVVPGKKGLRDAVLAQIESQFDSANCRRIMLIEGEINSALKDYLSKFNQDLHHHFDPKGIIYDSFADPPVLM